MPNKPVVISGMQPTGPLHIGNYLGALKNWIEIQNSDRYDCFFFVADYHSLGENYRPKEKQEQIYELVAEYIAAGLDPTKAIIFVQSQVPICTELSWIFNTITPVAELERMTQFKDKASRQKQNINMGLFDYPVLQAADILLYKGEFVPVGEDQVQHVELTRDIARWFNRKYHTDFFPETKPLLTASARVMSPASPENKMSKSLGDRHWIGLAESPEEINKKITKAASTPAGIINLQAIFEGFKSHMRGEFNPEAMKESKIAIAQGLADYFADFRKKKAELLADKKQLADIMAVGRKKATKIAQVNIKQVKEIIGVA